MTRDSFIQAHLQEIGLDSFPDDADVVWQLGDVTHKGDYSMVEAAPKPATVGYPRFRFVLRFDASDHGVVVGCYALIGDAWKVLFTDPAAGTEWHGLFG